MFALSAICSALYFREIRGIGQHIDVTLVDSLFALMGERVQAVLLEPQRALGGSPGGSLIYPGKDGYVTMTGLTKEQQVRFYKAMGREDLLTDPKFDTPEHRFENAEELTQIITEWVQSFDSIQQVISIMQKADVECTPILSINEAITHPHFVSHGMTQEVDDPERGKVKVINSPFRFSHSESGLRGSYPKLGEHNHEVLSSLLGRSAREVDQLQEEGVMYSELG
jgi:CoA:oxalate CoA-transferase